MADALSGFLAGVERGSSTGLAMYQTIQNEKRQQRAEERQTRLDNEEASWRQKAWDRQVQRDSASDQQWQATFDAGRQDHKDTVDYQNKSLAQSERHQRAQIGLGYAQLAAQDRRAQEASDEKHAAELTKRIDSAEKGGHAAFQGLPSDVKDYATYANGNPYAKLAVARKFGLNVSHDEVQNLMLIPSPDGSGVTIGKRNGDKIEPYAGPDRDGDGKADPVFIPHSHLASQMGGDNGIKAAGAFSAVRDAKSDADNQVVSREVNQLANTTRSIDGNEAVARARLETLDQQLATLSNAPKLVKKGGMSYANPELFGLLPNGTSAFSPERAIAEKRVQLEAERNRIQGSLGSFGDSRRQVAGEAQRNVRMGLEDNANSAVSMNTIPMDKRRIAADNYAATAGRNLSLANFAPGKDPIEATKESNKEVAAFTKDIMGSLDLKVLKDEKGKPMSAKGVEARVGAALSALTPEQRLALRDDTGQMKGTLQKQLQVAVESGQPEALPFLVNAAGQGLDTEFVARAMKHPGLAKVSNPNERYNIAVRAAQIKASDPKAAESLGDDGLMAKAMQSR